MALKPIILSIESLMTRMSLSPGAHGREAYHFLCERLMTWINLSPGADGLETHTCLNEVLTE